LSSKSNKEDKYFKIIEDLFQYTPIESKNIINNAVNSLYEIPEEYKCSVCNLLIY
jgi:hypothetical protein